MTGPAAAIELATSANAVEAFANCTASVGGDPVTAIFDNGFADVLNFNGTQPGITCLSADVADAALGTAVVVDGTDYTVAKIQADGSGLTKLLLQES